MTVAPAGDVVPRMRDGLLLHSGPPIAWERVCDPQRRALTAAAVFEGWAADREGAERLLAAGEIALEPGNEHDHVGPMTGRLLAVDAGLGRGGRRACGRSRP